MKHYEVEAVGRWFKRYRVVRVDDTGRYPVPFIKPFWSYHRAWTVVRELEFAITDTILTLATKHPPV